MNKCLERPAWTLTHPGEGVTVDKMESSGSRTPDMHLGSHTMVGVTIMEQRKDFYLEIGNRLLRGVMIL